MEFSDDRTCRSATSSTISEPPIPTRIPKVNKKIYVINTIALLYSPFLCSLSSGDGATTTTGTTAGGNATEIQYGPGPSLRPQTEGSWIQGGSRPVSSAVADDPSRSNNSGPLAAPPQLPVPVGQQPLPPQFRGVLPPFVS